MSLKPRPIVKGSSEILSVNLVDKEEREAEAQERTFEYLSSFRRKKTFLRRKPLRHRYVDRLLDESISKISKSMMPLIEIGKRNIRRGSSTSPSGYCSGSWLGQAAMPACATLSPPSQ